MAAACSGWLWKKGHWGVYGERRRWFVLDADAAELCYYKERARLWGSPSSSPTDNKVRGCIRLCDILSVEASKAATNSTFVIVSSHRSYELRAESESEAQEWVSTLNPLIASNSSGATSTPNLTLLKGMSSAKTGGMTEPLIMPSTAVDARSVEETSTVTTYLPAVPWSLEAIWLDDSQHDAAVAITADLGPMPTAGFKKLNIMLSDGTKMALDCGEFEFGDGAFHEVACADDKVLLAQIVKKDVPQHVQTAKPIHVPFFETVPLPISALCLLNFAAGCAFGQIKMPWTFAAGLCATLLAWSLVIIVFSARGQGRVDAEHDAETGSADGYKLNLRAAVKLSRAPTLRDVESVTQRLSHVGRKATSALSRLDFPKSSDALEVSPNLQLSTIDASPCSVRSENAVVFTGRWKLNLDRSDDPSEMLKAMGVPMLVRSAVARYARTVMIEQDGLEWTETMVTPVMTKTVTFSLDGTPYMETSPVDKATLTMVSQYEEDGQAVVTRSKASDGIKSQVCKRYLIEGGKTYTSVNTLKVGALKDITITSYFDKIG